MKEKNKESEGKLVRTRTRALIGIFAVILAAFFFVLYDVQCVNGQAYLNKASYSVARTENVSAARGELSDCYGRILVSNKTSYEVTLDTSLMGTLEERYAILASLLEICREQDVEWKDSLPVTDYAPFGYTLNEATKGEVTRLRKLSEEMGWGKWSCTVVPGGVDAETGEQLDPIEVWTPALTAPQLIATMREEYQLDEYLPDLTDKEVRALIGVLYELDLRKKEITYSEYVFADEVDITFITVVREHKLTGVVIEAEAVRQYQTTSAAHILGRISAVTAEQWEGDGKTEGYRDKEGYSYNDKVGQDGVEKAFEEYLHGISGTRAVETDANGKVTNESWISKPEPGYNVSLTIDIRLQEAVEQTLANHIGLLEESAGGAAVVVDMTGGVLAMASYPDYDLSTYSQSFSELATDPLKPLYNRATQGTYMPGSIFKMVTAVAALEEGVIGPRSKIEDTGVFTGYTSDVTLAPKCWIYRQKGTTHGVETVADAIRDSCNVFFYELGYRMGIETLGKYAKMFGLGSYTGIEIPERTGYVAGPETSAILGVDWYEGATTAASIGQENNLYTPIQLANYIATLVNGGTHYEVHLLKSVKSADYGEVIYEHEPVVLDSIDIEDKNLEAVKQGMYEVTQSSSSIARHFNQLPVKAGAKTGTAQVNNNTSTNATFVCFAPYDDPQVALCLVVEKGSSGASLAAMAAEILQFYFSTEDAISAVTGENTLVR